MESFHVDTGRSSNRVRRRNKSPLVTGCGLAIKGLISDGMFQRIDTHEGMLPKLYVMPSFRLLTFDNKNYAASICYMWAYAIPPDCPTSDLSECGSMLVIKDAMTNKQIGTYSPSGGGLSLD